MKRALLLILLAGCVETGPSDDPMAGIQVVAVLPFVNQSGQTGVDGDEFGNILASELVKIVGVRVLRPAQIRAALQPGEVLRSADDAIRVARRLRADAVLACAITDYDPYDPPKVAVSAQLLSVSSGVRSTADIDRLVQSASWHRGPLTMSRDRAGHALAIFEEVYDAHDQATRRALQAYARKHGESAFVREHEYLAVQSRYLQFVSLQVITRALEMLSTHGS